jgi:hypothetical protein
MTAGYRETSDESERRDSRDYRLTFFNAALAVMFGMSFFGDAISAQLGMTRSGFKWLTFAAFGIVMILVQRLLRNRRSTDDELGGS